VNWRNGCKLIIHLADAPAHGQYYCGYSNHQEEEAKLEPLIKRCATQGIKIIGMPIGTGTQLSYDRCKAIYDSAKGSMYEMKPFGSSDVSSLFKDTIVQAVIAAAPKRGK
jgi:hypothetical protein